MGDFTKNLFKGRKKMTTSQGSILFDQRAGKATRTVLIRGHENHVTPQILKELEALPYTISDKLMQYDGICFSVYGENLTIPILLHAYGESALMALLEQSAIKFTLESSVITYAQSDMPGVFPLQSGRLKTSVHKDPDASVQAVLSGLVKPPDGATLRLLARRLADAYVTPASDFAPTAVKFTHDNYSNGRFAKLGLVPSIELARLDLAGRRSLAGIAQQLLELLIMADLKFESVDEYAIMKICDDSIQNLANARKISDAAVTVFQIENVPQLSSLFADGILKTKDVPVLRQNPNCIKFRQWLRQTTAHTDAVDIARAYVDAVSHKHSFFETVKGKILKTLGVSGVSAAVGAVIAGPVGGAVGAVGSAFLEPAIDAGLSMLDEFLFDGLIKGWQPRIYFDKVVRPALLDSELTE